MLPLGACAEENAASTTKDAPSEQILESEKSVKKTVSSTQEEVTKFVVSTVKIEPLDDSLVMTTNKTPAVKETVIDEPVVKEVKIEKNKVLVAMADLPESSGAAPVVKEKTAAQAMLNLEQYRGKVVYLDFWASWCQPCQQTFPWMDAMQKKYPDDIVFIAVNFGENPEDTQEFLKRFPADIKFVYDPLVQIAREYGVPGLPYSFIYGRNGDLLGKHAGFSGGSEINLEAALINLFESGE